jgi:hypothetical protein
VLFNYNDFLSIKVKVKNVLKMIFSTIFKKVWNHKLIKERKNRIFKNVNGKKYFKIERSMEK